MITKKQDENILSLQMKRAKKFKQTCHREHGDEKGRRGIG